MERSLRSFTFFFKRTEHSFWFHKSYKNCKSRKKKNAKERSVLFIRLKKNVPSFFLYIFIYISIYIYKYLYIYLYISILKKERNVHLGLISCQKLEKRTEKNRTFLIKNRKKRKVPNGKEHGAQPWLRGK